MVIFRTKRDIATCVFGKEKYKPRFQLNKLDQTPSFTPFFNARTPTNPLILSVEPGRLNDRLRGDVFSYNANSVYRNFNNEKQSLFVYLGAFVFIGIMAWRYHCRPSLLIVGVANK